MDQKRQAELENELETACFQERTSRAVLLAAAWETAILGAQIGDAGAISYAAEVASRVALQTRDHEAVDVVNFCTWAILHHELTGADFSPPLDVVTA